MKRLFPIALISIMASFASCSEEDQATVRVRGTIQNLEQIRSMYPAIFSNDSLKIFLYEVPFGSEANPIQVDTAFVSVGQPQFELEGLAGKEGLYDIMIENGPIIPLVNDVQDMSVNIDLLDRDSYYTVQGSPASEQLREFIFSYSERSAAANVAFKKLDSLKLYKAQDSVVLAATTSKNSSLESLNNYVKNFLSTVTHSTVAAYVLGTASSTLPQNEFEAVLNKLVQKYPADSNLVYLKRQMDIRKEQAASQEAARNSWVGKPAPELNLPDANGKEIPLSSFKGKYVLVDFWASWCRPCRIENPNVVQAFNRYKDRNFTILGVSLDQKKESWLQAIDEDQLTWTHVSDLAFWNSKAVDIFRFEGIPYNVLINPDGIVIAEDLRGPELGARLERELRTGAAQ